MCRIVTYSGSHWPPTLCGIWALMVSLVVGLKDPVHLHSSLYFPRFLCVYLSWLIACRSGEMPLSPAGLCSFCDAFDVRVYARHQCGSPSYQCGDVVRGALDGCSFCCFVLDILAASDSVGGTVSQFWLRRVRKERRRLRAENPSTSIGDGLRSFWEQFICRGYWLDRWVRFSVSSGEDPGLDGMQISQMQLIVSFFGVHIGYSYLNVAADPGGYIHSSGLALMKEY
jgi:hypothetical protein